MMAEIEIKGVSCLGCMRRIERNMRQRKGVVRSELNASPSGVLAKISYDPALVKLDDLLAVIKQESDDFRVLKNEKVANRS